MTEISISSESRSSASSQEIQELAKTFTNETKSSKERDFEKLKRYLSNMSSVPGINPFVKDLEDKRLDPDSEQFDAKFWIKNLRLLHDSDPEYYKPAKLGVAYRNLRAYGIANDVDYRSTVSNSLWKFLVDSFRKLRPQDESDYFDILKPMDALICPGDITVVLGRPGAGCSTLLKTIAANTYGFHVDNSSIISYDGLTPKEIQSHFRGDVIYSAESDVHFPHLLVGDTLEFAAKLRTPTNRGLGVDRETYAKHMARVYMAMYGLSHTRYTKVGNDFIRGISGGERKRVSIAEVSLSGSKIQCWDNATRGLDAATALEFIRALKTSATILETTPIIAIYQCSQNAYDLFDKVIVLYEGYQIFFGRTEEAKDYFARMGWKCPPRQTTADFLTSLTNPAEREPLPGFELKVPRTPSEFGAYWNNSPEYKALMKEINQYLFDCKESKTNEKYRENHAASQAKYLSWRSPYTVSFNMQVKYILQRNYLRFKGDPSIALFQVIGQTFMGVILASMFYNLPSTTDSFFLRGSAMFFGVLFNAFASLLEIMSLFEGRAIVEKHKKYALYTPSADALASVVSELPVKLLMILGFNIIYYFMINFRRTPGRFFFFLLMSALCTLTMSHLFRTIGALSTSLASAMTPADVLLLAMVIYAGFIIPSPKMLGWAKWISYCNPISYIFESLMVNEFHNREFECTNFIPNGSGFDNVPIANRICNVVGAQPGETTVNGSDFLKISYNYTNEHKWRNFGIAVAFAIFFLGLYVFLTEFNKGEMQKGEIVLFLKQSLKKKKQCKRGSDIESRSNEKVPLEETTEAEKVDNGSPTLDMDSKLPSSKEIFFWRDLTYQIKIKDENRTILDHVDGWVKPGQITALMGASGAGKTTLLNCLSERLSIGVITNGLRMVNGHSLDSSFQRSIGYVQQQDLHLPNSTVREALTFSAYLRQSRFISKKEKDGYVDYIIDLLEMTDYADALVGVAGEGLNVEQRKRLTIGVELAAKPKLLLFLDEPTSGLDSQTAWSICKLMRKLADHGQAILCTIHQPSALLMKEFDRLLFLQAGGQTVYFGDIGENFKCLIDYFEKYGATPCPEDANPAEWMLEVVGAAPGSHASQDYFQVWRKSREYQEIQDELRQMETGLVKLPRVIDPESNLTYSAPIWKQYRTVTKRSLIQSWRSPRYIYSKILLVTASSLFNGFSFFKADKTIQGLQNQMFATFMFFIPFETLVEQMLPFFVEQRDVFEMREAPSRTFSWFAFITAQITSEIPYQIIVGTLAFFSWYYPVGLYANAAETDEIHSRGVLMWLFVTAFFVYTSTMGQLCISFLEVKTNAANLATYLFTMCITFCGVLITPSNFPRFWIFMYRCNPITYIVQGMLATGLANTKVTCSSTELLAIEPPPSLSCNNYLGPYVELSGGYFSANPNGVCEYCKMNMTNDFLDTINAHFSERWRNWGIFISFIAVNIVLTVVLYWVARVPRGSKQRKLK
ncbi:drug resistance protein 2 [Spathaspora passalidarum NRRL Y-27907]|uniref:Drug resistance protein 2 n=1 Tax=Spathaspora passalidarum (strain NRRL Y-27907 / 11-Y1) TaxID=619300 RepID=G3AQ40_SPAPN|nr:drug resistance protein 2 [Spathaspora passalidarum NRRL Y-27907]EGW31387.1 drug resistance protein 2 [Spathaspora passalidarum NRRL Y-27907]